MFPLKVMTKNELWLENVFQAHANVFGTEILGNYSVTNVVLEVSLKLMIQMKNDYMLIKYRY